MRHYQAEGATRSGGRCDTIRKKVRRYQAEGVTLRVSTKEKVQGVTTARLRGKEVVPKMAETLRAGHLAARNILRVRDEDVIERSSILAAMNEFVPQRRRSNASRGISTGQRNGSPANRQSRFQ